MRWNLQGEYRIIYCIDRKDNDIAKGVKRTQFTVVGMTCFNRQHGTRMIDTHIASLSIHVHAFKSHEI